MDPISLRCLHPTHKGKGKPHKGLFPVPGIIDTPPSLFCLIPTVQLRGVSYTAESLLRGVLYTAESPLGGVRYTDKLQLGSVR